MFNNNYETVYDDDKLELIDDDDEIIFTDEDNDLAPFYSGIPDEWKVLIVDDEEEVHSITKLVLSDIRFDSKPVVFLSAYSSKEAKEMLADHPDIALILLDVVMESDDAGLNLVKYIRNDMSNPNVRIVLRTGQPGQAPEREVIEQYDINDYKEKTELTAQKLFTTVISSLRSYQQILTIVENSSKLENVISSSSTVFKLDSFERYSVKILQSLENLIPHRHPFESVITRINEDNHTVIGGTGRFSPFIGCDVHRIDDGDIVSIITSKPLSGEIEFFDDAFIYPIKTEFVGHGGYLYSQGTGALQDFDRYLINIFCANISISFDNFILNSEIKSTQRDILFNLGEVAEFRSKETGNHVRRVSEYTYILAKKYGIFEDEAERLKMASPMHDIGKLGIPDAILGKPGSLNDDEFEIMKTHTTMGQKILMSSERELFRIASVIAAQHHEKYNGKGYPNGLRGHEIHIYGRLVAVADVFDALLSSRVYKTSWTIDRVMEYFKSQRDEQFDGKIVDILLENIDEFIRVHNTFVDKDSQIIIK